MSKHSKGKHTQSKSGLMRIKKKLKSKDTEEAKKGADLKAPAASPAPDASASAPAAGLSAAATVAMPAVEVPQPGGFTPATAKIEKKHRSKKQLIKIISIVTLCVLGTLAIIYFAGVFVFSGHFLPRTTVGTMDISLKTPEQVQTDFEAKVGDYNIAVKGHGLNMKISSEDAGLDIDAVAMTDAIASGQNSWAWPIDIFYPHDVTQSMTDALSATKLSEVVQGAVDEVNATATDPVDAHVQFDPASKKYVIAEEKQGTKLDYETVLQDIVVGAMSLSPQVIITDADLVQPAVLKDDERLFKACEEANELVKADITLTLDGTTAAEVDAEAISNWVTITPEFTATLDEGAMDKWIGELASKFNTVGTKRSYTRPDGKQVTVSGGDYGWKVNSSELASTLSAAILAGSTETISIPVLQSGNGFSGIGNKDWGNRYVDVDLSEQYARFYDSDGTLIWESHIVSGAPTSSRATPQGVYDINSKGTNVTLVGRDTDGDGKPEYETPVKFWMPFKGNSVGFHDATWQSAFGGSRYRNGFGSHGCVNLPYSKAESLYGLIKVGDVVVVHQ